MMKYLVTFAWSNEVEYVKDLEYDDYASPVKETMNQINFHSVIIKTDEKNQLSNKIKEEKEAFLKIKEKERENSYRRYEYKYQVDWLRCVGITPIENDEIEIAIKEHCFDKYDDFDDEEQDIQRQYIILENRFDKMIKELFSRISKAKFTEEHIERMIELVVSYVDVDCCHNELDDFLESKFSDIGTEWLDGYKSLIKAITHQVFWWDYIDKEGMSLKEYINKKREEILHSMEKYM